MKSWTLTEQVHNLWQKCLDLIGEIQGEGEPPRLEKLQNELAVNLAAVAYLFVNTQADIKDFTKTGKILIATAGSWVTTDITADRADQIGTVKIDFIPKPPDEAASEGSGADSSTEKEDETGEPGPAGSDS